MRKITQESKHQAAVFSMPQLLTSISPIQSHPLPNTLLTRLEDNQKRFFFIVTTWPRITASKHESSNQNRSPHGKCTSSQLIAQALTPVRLSLILARTEHQAHNAESSTAERNASPRLVSPDRSNVRRGASRTSPWDRGLAFLDDQNNEIKKEGG